MPQTQQEEMINVIPAKNNAPTARMKSHLNVAVLIIMVVICVLVIVNLFKVSVIENAKYESLANNYHFGTMKLEAQRGAIYDATGTPLAWSATVYNIYIDPTLFREEMDDINKSNEQKRNQAKENKERVDENKLINVDLLKSNIAKYLAEKLDIDESEVMDSYEKDGRYYVLQTQVEKNIADEIMDYFSEKNLISFSTQASTRRYYPQNELAASVIGFTNGDGNGQYGLEYQYDSYLSGMDGRIISAQAANGEEMPYRYSTTYNAENGQSLCLTIDTTIQYYLEKALGEMVTKFNVQKRACGIIMNPKTGAIYAMATYPTFDLNNPSDIFDEATAKTLSRLSGQDYTDAYTAARELQWKNKAVSEIYIPGSVFKVFTSASAFEEKLINLKEDMFYCSGQTVVEDRTIGCSNRSGHGAQTFTQALTNSCNPAFMEIGFRLGIARFYNYLEAFGLTEKTGIDLPGEADSITVTGDTMSVVDLASSSFGQVNKVTPIQMITGYAAAINGGNLVVPYLVEKIVDDDGNVVEEHQTEIKRQVVSEETSEIMRQQFLAVVESNSGHNAHIEGYKIGGKSGTAEKLDEYDGSNEAAMQYAASYCCFAPADDPEIIMLIMADEPDTSINYYGSAVVVSYARSVMESVLPYMGFYPEQDNIVEASNVTVPIMQDKSLTDARATLEKLGLTYQVIGNGQTVLRQCPKTGSSIAKGGIVLLYTDETTEAKYVEVPNLIGYTAAEADQILQNAGLNIVTLGASAENVNARVQFQSETEGSLVEAGTVISLTMTINDQTG